MKHRYNIFKHSGFGALVMLSLFFVGLTSCEEDDDTGAAPVIERVRFTDPTTADSSFSKAPLGSTLAIVGKNLASSEYVYINDYAIRVNSAYATDQHLIVSVLDSVPTIATEPDVPNTLRVVSPFGEASYNFQTLPPAPVVEQVSNQYAKAGESLTLYGKYFYFVDTVFLPGDIEVTEGISTNGSSLTLTLPANYEPTLGRIIVSSQSGNSSANRASQLYTGHGIVSNFDDVFPWGWGINAESNVTTEAEGIEAIDNKFALVNMTLPSGNGWSNDKVINMVDWGGAQIYPTSPEDAYDPSLPISDFDARMEVAVSSEASIDGVMLQMYYENENSTGLTTEVALSDFVRSQDGRWYTLSIPLNKLANGNVKLNTYADLLTGNANSEHHFRIVINNPTADDVPIILAIDNVRVVNAELEF